MCIRDRPRPGEPVAAVFHRLAGQLAASEADLLSLMLYGSCLLYTSDAADERSSVDLGGRRIIKKKKHQNNTTEDNYTT